MWERLTLYTQFHGHKVSGLGLGNWLAVARFVPLCSDMGLETQQSFIDAYASEPYLRIIRPDEEKFYRPGDMLAFVRGSGEHTSHLSSLMHITYALFCVITQTKKINYTYNT